MDRVIYKNQTAPHVYRESIAKAFGKANGFIGKPGGWIYSERGQGVAIAQGWLGFFDKMRNPIRHWFFQEIG